MGLDPPGLPKVWIRFCSKSQLRSGHSAHRVENGLAEGAKLTGQKEQKEGKNQKDTWVCC